MTKSLMRSVVPTVVALAVSLPAAHALELHLRLTRSEPAEGTVVTKPPDQLRLWFSERPRVEVSSITLSGPDGPASVSAVRAGKDTLALEATIESPLVVGEYVVRWRTAGRDGHVLRGEFAFQISTTGGALP